MARVRFSFSSRKTGHIENISKQKVKFPAVMKEVIKISDIVLQVLDARFVSDMRNTEIDEMISSMGKKTIYVLNKADLVDLYEVKKDLQKDLRPYVFVSVKNGRGISELRNLIKIEAKRVELPSGMNRVHVGIIGYPNAGKSSLINKISRRGVASISKQAGHTKGMQKIKLCEGILLLDTPGVIPESEYNESKAQRRSLDAKLGSRTYSNVKDPEDVVSFLMEDFSLKIEAFYKINAKGNSEDLIEALGKKRNFLKKGGVVDFDRTARLILRDWQEGNIK